MTSKTIPPEEDESRREHIISGLADGSIMAFGLNEKWLALEVLRLRATQPDREAIIETLKDVTAHLVGAASAYRKHASRHPSKGRAVKDPMFSTRADDFDKAVERGLSALKHSDPTPEGGENG